MCLSTRSSRHGREPGWHVVDHVVLVIGNWVARRGGARHPDGMPRDPITDARELVAELFPQARWAVVTGSVVTSRRTPGSDLDIVVVLPDHDPAAPHRDSRHWRNWPVELFVHDAASLAHYLDKDLPARRPTLHRMVATGVLLTSDDPHAQQVRAECAAVLAAGPAPLTAEEHAWGRYRLTDLIDDLTHAQDPAERLVIAASTRTATAQQALAFADHWTGTSKWLLRELRDLDTALTDRWVAAHGRPDAITAIARDVLDNAGGPLFAGFRAASEHPTGPKPAHAADR
jgi:hypothetical protein